MVSLNFNELNSIAAVKSAKLLEQYLNLIKIKCEDTGTVLVDKSR